MKLTRPHFLTAAIAVIGISATLAAAPARADEWKKTYQVSGRASLYVKTGDGDVTITGADQKQIDAEVMSDGYRIGPNDVQVVESQNGDHVSIEIKFPHMSWHMWGGHHSLHVDVRVPRELDLDVRTGDGNVMASNVSGKLQFQSGDGNVSANNIHGDIRMHTGDGSIDAQAGSGSRVANSWNVHSGDGSITLRLASDLNANLEAHTGDGNITL